jgi:hypothetical protein
MNNNLVTVFPKPGNVVRHPDTHAKVPENGLAVEWNVFWERRLRDGDITLDAPSALAKGKKAANKE